jgi:hypothetical protein
MAAEFASVAAVSAGSRGPQRSFTLPAIALAVLLGLPALLVAVPPLADLPGHMARYYVESRAGGAAVRDYFVFNWQLTGNLGCDAIMQLLVPWLGVEPATRLVVGFIPVLLGIGMLLVAREAHGKLPATAPAALPLALAWPYQMGFVNYWLSVALAFLAFALWMRMGRSAAWSHRRSLVFLLVGVVLWAAHVAGWALLLLLCWASEFVQSREKRLAVRSARALLTCLCLGLPLLLMAAWRSGQHASIGEWPRFETKLQWLAGSLRDRWIVVDLLSLAFVFGCVALPILQRGRARYSPTLLLPGCLLLVIGIIGPELVFGSMFASTRLLAVGLILLVLSVGETEATSVSLRSTLMAASVAFCIFRIGAGIASFQIYDRSYREQMELIAGVERKASIAAFVGQPCPGKVSSWTKSRLEYLPSLAVVRHDAFVNNLFIGPGSQGLAVVYPKAGRFTDESSALVTVEHRGCVGGYPPTLQSSLRTLPFGAFDYLWLVDVPRQMWPRAPQLQLVAQKGNSALFRIGGAQ